MKGNLFHNHPARPISALTGYNPSTGEWNDSLTGDFLWSNVNFGEAVTETMTPLAWSVLQFTLKDWNFLADYPNTGNIGYNPYINISVMASLYKASGRNQKELLKNLESTLYMQLPEDMELPLISLTAREVLSGFKNFIYVQVKQREGLKHLPTYLATNANWFQQTRTKLEAVQSRAELAELWRTEIAPHVKQGVWTVLGSVAHSAEYTMALKRKLTALIGAEDAALLIANGRDQADLLPSLGPVAGLAQLSRGEVKREAFLEKYGHRGPHEFEISKPRPVEDPFWLDQQVAQFTASPVEVEALFDNQRGMAEAAWKRFLKQYPRKAKSTQHRLSESRRRAYLREEARSEYVRDRWMVRLFALRAGELAGLQEDVFFLTLDEVLAVLRGGESAIGFIATRKETYQRYKALPPLPSIICGRFHPLEWAADPNRRSDVFDAHLPQASKKPTFAPFVLIGSPGSAGRVEGRVRILVNPADGMNLQEGEILVTRQTDISWTTLFPRAAAVITDIGAPLSHAAIVARELGIPAVVGCGDATMRLKTGNRVRVDGGKGTVEILTAEDLSFHIRYAVAVDNTLLAKLGSQTFTDSFGPDNTPENMHAYLAASFSPEKQARELADAASRFLIIEQGQEVVGYAHLNFGPAPAAVIARKPMEIVRFYASKEWIGKGVGAQLMKACLREAESAGCDIAWLDVWEHNPRAIAFYRKWGFEQVGAQVFQLGKDMQNDWLMSKAISSNTLDATNEHD